MKGQWKLIFGLVAAIIVAIFAVINVNGVRVNYLFGTAEWPLILVILGSVLMGALIAGALGTMRVFRLQAELKHLKAEKETVVAEIIEPNQNNETEDEPQLVSRKRYKKESNE